MRHFEDKVIYQIYPKSFCDSNHDGIGDFQGIINKLDYLQTLGVDYIWLNACFASPQKDNGYDVSDYYQIDPVYGTMADFEALCLEAKQRGIDIMLDMVFNHTSTEHEWFKKAVAGDPHYRDYYYFLPPKADGSAPTNWRSKFGGPAWHFLPELNQYYLHLFDQTQADLNWESLAVREEMQKIVKFWQGKGVNGFRFDVVNLISKPTHFLDDEIGDGRRFYTDGAKVSDYLRELNQASFGDNPASVTVGEMSSTTLEKCVHYANGSQDQLSMVFNFHHLKVDYANNNKWQLMSFDFQALKNLFFDWQIGMQEANAWMALFWCNHDQPRVVSRFGDEGQYHVHSAKMLATAIHCLRGTPYIYQGEELGMCNAHFTSIEQYRDVESLNYYAILQEQGLAENEILAILAARSRDNARTPMPWNNELFAGFSTVEPWIGIPQSAKQINVEANLADSNSVFYHYQKLIKLRKQHNIIQSGEITPLLHDHPKIFAYQRSLGTQRLIVLNNFYAERAEVETASLVNGELSDWQCLLNNYDEIECSGSKLVLQPYQSVVLLSS